MKAAGNMTEDIQKSDTSHRGVSKQEDRAFSFRIGLPRCDHCDSCRTCDAAEDDSRILVDWKRGRQNLTEANHQYAISPRSVLSDGQRGGPNDALGHQHQLNRPGEILPSLSVCRDPLADITELERVKFVTKGGHVVGNELNSLGGNG